MSIQIEGTSVVKVDGVQAGQKLKELKEKASELRKEFIEMSKQPLVDANRLKEIKNELSDIKDKTIVLKKESIDYQKTLSNLSGASLSELNSSYKKLAYEIKGMTRNTEEYKQKAGDLSKIKSEITKVKGEMQAAGVASKTFGDNFRSVTAGILAATGIQNVFGMIAGGIKNAINTIKEFATGISQLQAITGASGNDLDYLKSKAIDLAAEYGKSAKEIVNAMKMVGSAKPELLENVHALGAVTEAVLTLSKASSMDLTVATSSLTTIMNQFGHGAAEATNDINILAASSKYGAVEVDYLSEALSKSGTVMKSAKLSLEQGTAAMELFGEKGIKAETAGTGFKSILVKLQADTKNYTNGVFDLNKAIDNNQAISSDNIALQEKFGKEFFNLAQILFQGKDRFNQLTQQITGTNVAFEQAAIASDNWQGDLDKAGGAWDKFILSIENGNGAISKALRSVTQTFSGLITMIADLNNGDNLTTSGMRAGTDETGQANARVKQDLEDIKKYGIEKTKFLDEQLNHNIISQQEHDEKINKISNTQDIALKNRIESYQATIKENQIKIGVIKKELETNAFTPIKGELKNQLAALIVDSEIEQKVVDKLQLSLSKNKTVSKNDNSTSPENTLDKETKKKNDEILKDTQALNDQLEQMNVALISDAESKDRAEVELWNKKEVKKVNSSSANTSIKTALLQTIEETHKKKIADIDDKYLQLSLDQQIAVNSAFDKGNSDKEASELSTAEKIKSIREQYGLVTDEERLTVDLATLQKALDDKLITQEDFERAKANIIKKYRDKDVKDTETTEQKKARLQQKALEDTRMKLGITFEFFSSMKDLELQSAGENEEKKKKIMKKYALVDLARNASQIISNTAEGIMKAQAQLGVAALPFQIIIGATGAVQLGIALAEAKKVQGLAGGGKFGVTRVQDNRQFTAEYGGNGVGYYDKPTVLVAEEGPEFVVSNKALKVPAFKHYIANIDAFQRGQSLKHLNYAGLMNSMQKIQGFAAGGNTNNPTPLPQNNPDLNSQLLATLVNKFDDFTGEISTWQRELEVSVKLQNIRAAEKLLSSIEAEVRFG